MSTSSHERHSRLFAVDHQPDLLPLLLRAGNGRVFQYNAQLAGDRLWPEEGTNFGQGITLLQVFLLHLGGDGIGRIIIFLYPVTIHKLVMFS